MKKEFIVERQGRSFVLYAGLLDLAHQQGLKSIHTELIQRPTQDNERVAICFATVVLEKDGIERAFTALGDAAPNNVTPAMQQCLIRMAETRSKARALRDAVNIGVAAFEELGEGEEPEEAQSYNRPSSRAARSAQTTTATRPSATGEMSERQEACIRNIAARTGHELPDMAGWTATQAGEFIKRLQATVA